MSTNAKIMGGMFGSEGLDYIDLTLPSFLKEPCLPLINGRSGIHILCALLKPRKIWMPSYLCHAMLEAIPREVRVEFYPVSESLQVNHLDWLQNVSKGDVAVFVDYFGFDLHQPAMQAVKEQGAWIVQDAAQALLSSYDRPWADFVLFSPRKTIGVPDGGILQSQCTVDFSEVVIEAAPPNFILSIYRAFFARTHFDLSGGGDWFSLYKEANVQHPIGHYRMTDLSLALLKNGFSYDRIVQIRRHNYDTLHKNLAEISLLGTLSADVVPFGFPIVSENRDEILSRLYSEKLFCPVHWPIEKIVPDVFRKSHHLSEKIITLVCDQRLDENALQKLISVVKGCL